MQAASDDKAKSSAADGAWEYAIVIDAGSTGSRAHVFKHRRPEGGSSGSGGGGSAALATVDLPAAVRKATPGLSSYARDPKAAGGALQPLIAFAKETVPKAQWARTPVHLLATAGLRMLPQDKAAAVLEAARGALQGSGFLFRREWARVISGQQEGLYGWLGINFATGALEQLASQQKQQQQKQGRKERAGGSGSGDSSGSGGSSSGSSGSGVKATQPLLGVLELGGGSLQVTVALPPDRRLPDGASAAPLARVPGLGGRQVYSHSFDGLGLQAALAKHEAALKAARAKADPCLPAGFHGSGGSGGGGKGGGGGDGALAGGGDWGACKAAARALLPRERCTFSRCSIGNVFTPPLDGQPLIGIDNFYYVRARRGACGASWTG